MRFFGPGSNIRTDTHWREASFSPVQIMETGIMIRISKAARPGSSGRQTPTQDANQKGQASIEFLLTFGFAIGFTLLFVSLAINMTRGYLVHYANFMASRTFLSHDTAGTGAVEQSLNAAQTRARQVFRSYPLGAFEIEAEFRVNKPLATSSLMSGTTATFRERMTPFSLVGGTNEATLHSESFLTKEPVRLQCLLSVCRAMGITNCNSVVDVTVFDNGC